MKQLAFIFEQPSYVNQRRSKTSTPTQHLIILYLSYFSIYIPQSLILRGPTFLFRICSTPPTMITTDLFSNEFPGGDIGGPRFLVTVFICMKEWAFALLNLPHFPLISHENVKNGITETKLYHFHWIFKNGGLGDG